MHICYCIDGDRDIVCASRTGYLDRGRAQCICLEERALPRGKDLLSRRGGLISGGDGAPRTAAAAVHHERVRTLLESLKKSLQDYSSSRCVISCSGGVQG